MNSKKVWISMLIAFFFAGVFGSYLLFHKFQNPEKAAAVSDQNTPPEIQDLFNIRIFYPVGNRLELAEKTLPRRTTQTAIAEAVVEEYFKGPGVGKTSCIPGGVKFLGCYRDSQQMLYVDLSDEVRRNFQGDALSEYLFLKGLYESLISNLQEIQDVKILVDGKEIETLGGHFFLKFPLKNVVASEFKGDKDI